jgi:hypothetical protein
MTENPDIARIVQDGKIRPSRPQKVDLTASASGDRLVLEPVHARLYGPQGLHVSVLD